MIVVAIVVLGGTMMLICGGIIFGMVMTIKDQGELVGFEVNQNANPQQWDNFSYQADFQSFTELTTEGRYAEAVEDIDDSLASDPDNAFLHNNKAWLLATCPDETVRDGELAIEHATKACELTYFDNFAYVDTLAAAYAEAGDFEAAAKWQEEAIELSDNAYLSDFHKRLRLFKAGKAYREGVPPLEEAVETTVAEEEVTDSDSAVETSEEPESTSTDETNTE